MRAVFSSILFIGLFSIFAIEKGGLKVWGVVFVLCAIFLFLIKKVAPCVFLWANCVALRMFLYACFSYVIVFYAFSYFVVSVLFHKGIFLFFLLILFFIFRVGAECRRKKINIVKIYWGED